MKKVTKNKLANVAPEIAAALAPFAPPEKQRDEVQWVMDEVTGLKSQDGVKQVMDRVKVDWAAGMFTEEEYQVIRKHATTKYNSLKKG
jgi:hypothetical protein